ncbi:protein Tob2 isoform X1 [Heterocephalus glaber]|uniref:Protein Tob2 isoform X1 n=1 Tax=Heterocephalus glaber TaxID=10181 RepID=A0AAX6P784_HETGA|nr:protein Tob2 isoform X1 [Heterocephalus glaber]
MGALFRAQTPSRLLVCSLPSSLAILCCCQRERVYIPTLPLLSALDKKVIKENKMQNPHNWKLSDLTTPRGLGGDRRAGTIWEEKGGWGKGLRKGRSKEGNDFRRKSPLGPRTSSLALHPSVTSSDTALLPPILCLTLSQKGRVTCMAKPRLEDLERPVSGLANLASPPRGPWGVQGRRPPLLPPSLAITRRNVACLLLPLTGVARRRKQTWASAEGPRSRGASALPALSRRGTRSRRRQVEEVASYLTPLTQEETLTGGAIAAETIRRPESEGRPRQRGLGEGPVLSAPSLNEEKNTAGPGLAAPGKKRKATFAQRSGPPWQEKPPRGGDSRLFRVQGCTLCISCP